MVATRLRALLYVQTLDGDVVIRYFRQTCGP